MHLFKVALLDPAAALIAKGFHFMIFMRRKVIELFRYQIDNLLMINLARCRKHHAFRAVTPRHEIKQIIA